MGSRPSTEDIHAYLRERILLLDLPPGARLREEKLADHFGVSRTPIRQVLHRLEFEGLVEQVPGAGARVSGLDPKALRDVWAVRLKLAGLIGEFVRFPVPAESLQLIEEIRADLKDVAESRDRHALGALYNRFHAAMLSVVDNAALARIQDLLYVQTARVWMQFLPEMDIDREVAVMSEEVDATLAALREGDGPRLAEIRTEHMQRLLKRFNDRLTSIPAIPA